MRRKEFWKITDITPEMLPVFRLKKRPGWMWRNHRNEVQPGDTLVLDHGRARLFMPFLTQLVFRVGVSKGDGILNPEHLEFQSFKIFLRDDVSGDIREPSKDEYRQYEV